MKLLSSLVFIIFLSSVSWSQQKMDKRLLTKYSVSQLNAIETNNPDDLLIMTYALDNAMYVANYSSQKGDVFVEIEAPKKNQTYIDLGLEILEMNQYFKIKGQDKLLVVKSRGVMMNELKIK